MNFSISFQNINLNLKIKKMKNSIYEANSQIVWKIIEKNININLTNLSGIFVTILNIINDKFEYCPDNYNILKRYIPMKYFNLIFNENYFEIKYSFPYIQQILISKISINEADDFFINNKFNFIQYLEYQIILFWICCKI